jgi:hypothetical protein
MTARNPGTGLRQRSRGRAGWLVVTSVVAVSAGLIVFAPGASAGPATAGPGATLHAGVSVARSCFTGPLPGAAGVDSTRATAPSDGLILARLSGGGDWDLAVYDQGDGRVVAGSAGMRTNELAEGRVTKDQKLLIQGCRYAGHASSAALVLEFVAAPASASKEPVQVVDVHTPSRADKSRLQKLDLDLTEHGTATSLQVLLHGKADEQKLRAARLTYTVRVTDLRVRDAARRQADERYRSATAKSDLPSGRTSYRRLFDYELEMKQLARRYPSMVRPFLMPHKTVAGRDVAGIEIAVNAANIADGKPIFFNMGVHHAREWPAGEHTMEWAQDLLTNYGKQDRTTRLVSQSRNIVVPIVNPDGFVVSREATPLGDFSTFDYEMKRKNCSSAAAPPEAQGGACGSNPAGRLRGTDLNRNYAGFWGGAGADTDWSSDVFRGTTLFSEPETQNIRELVSRRQVTNLITNHTYGPLVLRAPGIYETRPPLDEPQYKALGARMTTHNGYDNIPGYALYDTSGTTEDWTFWNTGGYGFTFEIGGTDFHPPFADGVVGEYLGRAPSTGAGKGGNREAYYAMLASTVDSAFHSTLTGNAPAGWKLRVRKEFVTPTSRVIQPDGSVRDPILYKDVLDSTFVAPGGTFRWAVNPSTRPYVAGRLGRDPVAPKQADLGLANPAGVPAVNEGDPVTGPHESVPFTVQGPPTADNGKLVVHIEWADPAVDWDVYVLNSAGEIVASSATGGTNAEDALLGDPPAGNYTAVLVNYAGGATSDWSGGAVRFSSPIPTTIGPKESWTFTCSMPDGHVRALRQVIVDRGQTVSLGSACTDRKQR